MPVQMPGIDQDVCREWTTLDRNLYNSYPFYLAKTQVDRRKTWSTFGKLTKKRKWTPNMGPIMRGVRKNPSPHIRQFAAPQLISSTPKEDVMRITETKTDTLLYWQDFSSPVLEYLPSFQDFMDHVDDQGEDIMEKVERYEEVFLRGMMFHMSPYMFVACGNTMELVPTTPFAGTSVLGTNDGKSQAVLQGILAAYGARMSHLTIASLASALAKMSTNLGIPPFDGTGLPEGDNKALNGKYALITHEEAWTQFTFDPYLIQRKNCDLDVVNGSFQGSLLGRITGKLEALPLFMKADCTFAAPEIETATDVALNQNEPVPNPEYANIAPNAGDAATACSPLAISWFSGQFAYESLQTGPPPAAFTKDTPPDRFPAMKWNGEVYLTKDFLIECPDATTGAIRYKTNSKGRYLKYESTLALGIFPRQRRNLIPILHLRRQGV
jgi:hypothetical protein